MSRKQRKEWSAFEDVTEDVDPQWILNAVGEAPRGPSNARVFRNNIYQVIVRQCAKISDDAPKMLWLSIKANDQSVRHDWREFQQIKNEIAGPEWEAIEIYPAESRLVDTSNQYHLWAFEPPFKMPCGFNNRTVMDTEEANKAGAKQRAFKVKPDDLLTCEEAFQRMDS